MATFLEGCHIRKWLPQQCGQPLGRLAAQHLGDGIVAVGCYQQEYGDVVRINAFHMPEYLT